MMRRVYEFLGRDVLSVHHAAYILALSSLLSQFLALFRDRMFAHYLGAGMALDTYYAAFRVQDLIYAILASLLSLAVLIPIITEKSEHGKEKVRQFATTVFSFTFFLLLPTSILAFIFAPNLALMLFPKIANSEFGGTLVELMRILLLSPFLLSLSSLLGAISQSYQKYYFYALSPLLYNVGIIIGIVFFYQKTGALSGLAFGVVLGALMHLLVQVPLAIRENFLPSLSFKIFWGDVKKVILLAFPRAVALSFSQIVFTVLVSLASFLSVGSITVLTFAMNLQSIPLAIIGASYAVATFPILSRSFSLGDSEKFAVQLSASLRHIIFWSMPAISLFIVLRAYIVRLALGTGAFSWTDTKLTAACLALFVISSVSQSLSQVFVRTYYATRRNSRPLYVSILGGLITLVFAFVPIIFKDTFAPVFDFVYSVLKVGGVLGREVIILPLSYSLGSIVSTFVFIRLLKSDFEVKIMGLGKTFWQSAFSSVLGGFGAYLALSVFFGNSELIKVSQVLYQGFFGGVVGLFVTALSFYLLRNEEFREISKALRAKFRKEEVIPPQEG
jgi:putative peptidoglycan lipid II flippase